MGIEKIDIKQFLDLGKDHPVIDVRSPGEYLHAHIPGAYSIPLFTDEERKVVGTAYKKESREIAIKIGLDFFGPKMKKLVEEVEKIIIIRQQAISKRQESTGKEQKQLSIDNCLLIHCWRGGMRSGAVAWLLDLYGFKVYTLIGGYKKYRNYVLETFNIPFNYKILGGYTGSGKTSLLKALKGRGEPVVDLEGIANHRGSAFGNIGLPKQPSQEMFENLLSFQLRNIIKNTESFDNKRVWLEDESQRIGLVNIPGELWNNMRKSPVYFLDIPFEERLKQIVIDYGDLDQESMTDAIGRISKKLGNSNAKTAILHLIEGKTGECFDILLKYYDKHYLKSLHNREGINSLLSSIECKSVTSENADQLLHLFELQQQKL